MADMTEDSKIPEWGTPPVPLEVQKIEIAKQLALLEALRKCVEGGTIVAISCVVIRANMVPEHAFALSPYSAAILCAGMEMAKTDLIMNARTAMMKARKPEASTSNLPPAAPPSDGTPGASSG